MARYDVCGNDHEGTLGVRIYGRVQTFDGFPCAIHRVAPCEHCNCRVIGPGVRAARRIFCCASCATATGMAGLRDHA